MSVKEPLAFPFDAAEQLFAAFPDNPFALTDIVIGRRWRALAREV